MASRDSGRGSGGASPSIDDAVAQTLVKLLRVCAPSIEHAAPPTRLISDKRAFDLFFAVVSPSTGVVDNQEVANRQKFTTALRLCPNILSGQKLGLV